MPLDQYTPGLHSFMDFDDESNLNLTMASSIYKLDEKSASRYAD